MKRYCRQKMLLLLLLLAYVSAEGITFRRLAVNSTNFVDDGALSGQIFVGPLSNITQIFYFGNDVTLTHGYNVTDLAAPVLLTFAVAFRDATQMPTVTLSTMYATVTGGTCMHSLTTLITQPGLGGDASAATNGTFAIGMLDSYNNVIAAGDMMVLDWGIFFGADVANQNATLNIYGQTQSFVLF
jgi:hypothetical protein